MSESNPTELCNMTAAAVKAEEARELVAVLVNTYPRSTPLKAVFPSIARRIRVSARRVAAIWHREARNIYASEMDDLRDLVAKCINADIERLEADLAVALASSNRVDAPEVFAAKAAVENAKTILKGIK
jgi:hypothetical protein